jgi:hypothetical protein
MNLALVGITPVSAAGAISSIGGLLAAQALTKCNVKGRQP